MTGVKVDCLVLSIAGQEGSSTIEFVFTLLVDLPGYHTGLHHGISQYYQY